MTDQVGDRFQQDTKYDRDRMPGGGIDRSSKPDVYKQYPDAEKIELPQPVHAHGPSLDEVIRARRSVRSYSGEGVSMDQLSYALWASTGIRARDRGHELRTAPSAGALYPIETYLVVNNVEGVGEGVYHYNIREHSLELLKPGDFAEAAAQAALGQDMCADCAVVFVWTAVFQRMKWKYGQRAYRYVYLDAGHIAENLALAATGLGLGSCQIGALYDDEVNELIGVDGADESVVYMSAVGKPC